VTVATKVSEFPADVGQVSEIPPDAVGPSGEDRTPQRHGDLAELIARLAADLIDLAHGRADATLEAAAEAVTRTAGAVEMVRYEKAPDRQQFVPAHRYGADRHLPDVLCLPEAGPLADLLLAGRAVIPSEEHGAEAAEVFGITPGHITVVAPLVEADAAFGVICWQFPAGADEASDQCVRLLDLFGRLVSRTLAARRSIAGLEASELRHRSVLDEIGDVVVRIGIDGNLSYVNKAWHELTGRPVADTVGADPMANVHPDDRALAAEHMVAAMSGRPGVREVRFLAKDGSVRWMEVKGRAVFDADGVPVGFSGVLHDVTERKAAEAAVGAARDEAERARDAAERASRAKSEFLSRMSHELRTPLNAILGFSQLLEFADLDDDERDNTEQIRRAGRHLLNLINDAMDISRIESGNLSMSLEPIRVRDAVNAGLDLVRTTASDLKVTLAVTGQDNATFVRADQQRLTQVMVNLLSNAIKYNRPAGRVDVSWRVSGDGRDGGTVRIDVADTGIGIADDRLADVFAPFERLGAETTEIDGTGIGLTLTKSMVTAMGGRLTLDSTVGNGSIFSVDLPLAAGPTHDECQTTGTEEDVAEAPEAVVYVEDNASNLTLMRRIFSRRPDIRLVSVSNGAQAVETILQVRPCLVLLDLHLPGSDGGEILAAVRSHADPAVAATPVIMVTADLTPGTERRLMAAGASAFLPKPVDIASLLAQVDAHAQRTIQA
jgi:PAS domain S-box-containing protein